MMRAGMRRNAPEPDEQEPMSWCRACAGRARTLGLRLCAGFIAREADADLVRKNAGLLRLRIAPVAGLV